VTNLTKFKTFWQQCNTFYKITKSNKHTLLFERVLCNQWRYSST